MLIIPQFKKRLKTVLKVSKAIQNINSDCFWEVGLWLIFSLLIHTFFIFIIFYTEPPPSSPTTIFYGTYVLEFHKDPKMSPVFIFWKYYRITGKPSEIGLQVGNRSVCQALLPQRVCGSVSTWGREGAQQLSQKQRGSLGRRRGPTWESPALTPAHSLSGGRVTEPISSPLRWD